MDRVQTFIEPIKKKWVYHFMVSPKTSLIEKPEWYLSQTLKWIHEYIDVVASDVKSDANVRHKFILCMIQLAMTRLTRDMNSILKSLKDEDREKEAILIHTYNEVILFVKVIRQLLEEQEVFEKIIEAEWVYAEKNLEEITTTDDKWEPVLEGEFIDNYKITRCVDRLLLLEKSLTERVECFLQPDCQFKLIELQCHLFNKFLAFLKKSTETHPVGVTDILFVSDESTIDLTRILCILNGVNFLRLVLKERYFIPSYVIDSLDKTLSNALSKLAQDYKNFFYILIEKVLAIYDYVDCDLKKFISFIKPKLSQHIFGIILDETSKLTQERQAKNILANLSSGSE